MKKWLIALAVLLVAGWLLRPLERTEVLDARPYGMTDEGTVTRTTTFSRWTNQPVFELVVMERPGRRYEAWGPVDSQQRNHGLWRSLDRQGENVRRAHREFVHGEPVGGEVED